MLLNIEELVIMISLLVYVPRAFLRIRLVAVVALVWPKPHVQSHVHHHSLMIQEEFLTHAALSGFYLNTVARLHHNLVFFVYSHR